MFVRFQSAVPNRRGTFPGVFALANGLSADGFLSDADADWWRAANDRAEADYVDPTVADPTCFDPTINPGARSWFKSDAAALIRLARQYLDLLDRYGVPWVELRTRTPGHVVYEDPVQVVATPFEHSTDWPFDS